MASCCVFIIISQIFPFEKSYIKISAVLIQNKASISRNSSPIPCNNNIEVISMNIHIDETTHETDVWLTGAERSDPCASMLLDKIIESCRKSGYMTTVFVSGTDDLNGNIKTLVLRQTQ